MTAAPLPGRQVATPQTRTPPTRPGQAGRSTAGFGPKTGACTDMDLRLETDSSIARLTTWSKGNYLSANTN